MNDCYRCLRCAEPEKVFFRMLQHVQYKLYYNLLTRLILADCRLFVLKLRGLAAQARRTQAYGASSRLCKKSAQYK